MFKVMQSIDGSMNMSLLRCFQFPPTFARTVFGISSFNIVLESRFLFIAHIARYFDYRPTQFVVMVLVATLEGDFR
tara:strand:- start:393 stop:620 length:228 start_codon:yes stop_codon:yes gene_type:complete